MFKEYTVSGYTYFPTKSQAMARITSVDEDVAYEAGLGWYVYNKKIYAKNPLRRLFGFG